MHQLTEENGSPAPVVTSAGALVDGLHELDARKVALITPYMKPLTKLVVDYIANAGIEGVAAISLEIPDHTETGCRGPHAPTELAVRVALANVDAVVASACVQMPSLAAVPAIESRLGLPVISAATCTTFFMLRALGLREIVPEAGSLLGGRYARAAQVESAA